MRKISIVSVLICLTNLLLHAVPAQQKPFDIVQPNGDTITVVHMGDEYMSWFEIANTGEIINMDNNGVWRYVKVNSGSLVLTEIVNTTDIATASVSDNKTEIMQLLSRRRNKTLALEDSLANAIDFTDSITALSATNYELPIQKSVSSTLSNKKAINILTILVDFKDRKFMDATNVKQQFQNLMNQTGYRDPVSGSITGSVRDFYFEASYGQLDFTTTVVGPYTASENHGYYDEENLTNTHKLVKEAITMADKDVDMKRFDNNEDGYVDGIHIVFAGQGQETSYVKSDIWSHRSSIPKILKDGVWISMYMMTPELYSNSVYTHIGVICHEFGHILGAPDFYDTDSKGSGGYFKGTGDFDLMAGGSWNGHSIFYNGNICTVADMPAHPNPFIKTQLFGWASRR